MNPELKSVSDHMLNLGLGALAHANWHAHYHSMENDQWSNLSVLQAAHAAEILIKARIAEEHPLLVLDHFPKPTSDGSIMTFEALLREGRAIQYRDLPDRLWACTGIRLPNLNQYREFGHLRNMVQHMAAPKWQNLSQVTLEFIFGVLDPFINECWDCYAIDFNEDYEPYEYFVPGIISREIEFLVSPESVSGSAYMDFEWPDNETFKDKMTKRFEAASGEG